MSTTLSFIRRISQKTRNSGKTHTHSKDYDTFRKLVKDRDKPNNKINHFSGILYQWLRYWRTHLKTHYLAGFHTNLPRQLHTSQIDGVANFTRKVATSTHHYMGPN